MYIYGLTARWFKAAIFIVVAKDLEEAVRMIQGKDVLCPWNTATVIELWAWELKGEPKSEIVASYKPDSATSTKILDAQSQKLAESRRK